VYYRAATITVFDNFEPDAALELVNDGLKLLNSEYERLQVQSNTLDEATYSSMEEKYQTGLTDLNSLRLEIFITFPNRYEEAIKEFESAMNADSGNYELLVAYASLLENTEPNKAIEIYATAISVDRENELAYFNSGVIYYNSAKHYYEQAGITEDSEEYNELMAKASHFFKTAKPYFLRVLEINPKSLESVIALKNIAIVMKDADATKKYTELENQLDY
jgi:tetratricopeptide (TPR) repeat protein